jgi:large subunit ribosomal protein L29
MATRKKKDAAATPAKVSKAATLRDKDVAGLQTEIKDLQKAHFGLRMQKATQQLTNNSQLKKTRREIARARTIIAEKNKGAAK